MDFHKTIGIEDFGPYQIHSRREIVSLLRNIHQRNQLVRMVFNNNSEAIVTSILDIDTDSDSVVVDCAPEESQNKRILASGNLSFESMLDRIRILFFASYIEPCKFEDRLAFRIPLPASLIRLQRREYYRVETPNCRVVIPFDTGDGKIVEVTASMRDLSVGGIGMVDDSMTLDTNLGRIYTDCRIFLSDGQVVRANLQVRSFNENKLLNGKMQRRLGCLFVELPNQMLMIVQRYITKLERERNAKMTGMA